MPKKGAFFGDFFPAPALARALPPTPAAASPPAAVDAVQALDKEAKQKSTDELSAWLKASGCAHDASDHLSLAKRCV
jgi:hypothetical protein